MSYQPAAQQQPATYQPSFTQEETKPISWTVILKIGYLVVFSGLLIGGAFFLVK